MDLLAGNADISCYSCYPQGIAHHSFDFELLSPWISQQGLLDCLKSPLVDLLTLPFLPARALLSPTLFLPLQP
jgi:hypothetical protein